MLYSHNRSKVEITYKKINRNSIVFGMKNILLNNPFKEDTSIEIKAYY
jgi:hypothetical protein